MSSQSAAYKMGQMGYILYLILDFIINIINKNGLNSNILKLPCTRNALYAGLNSCPRFGASRLQRTRRLWGFGPRAADACELRQAIGSSTCRLPTHSFMWCWYGVVEWSFAIIAALYPGIIWVEHFGGSMSQYQWIKWENGLEEVICQ
jgi:hypothetical protein